MKEKHITQRGAVLLMLVIAMTITAALGAGMVYLSSSASLTELFSNQESRAYYIAEGGGRYAFSLLKTNSACFDAYTQANPYNQTFTFLNNSGQFNLVAYLDATNPDNVVIKSTGTINAGSWVQAKRLVQWNVSKTSISSSASESVNLTDFLADQPKNGAAGDYSIATIDGSTALKVDAIKTGNPEEAYIAMPVWTSSNPFYKRWYIAGGFLSYDSQVKVAIGLWGYNFFTWSYEFLYRPAQYCMGITTQHHRTSSAQQHYFYGLSIVRTHNTGGSGRDNIPDSIIPTGVADNTPMVMLWIRNQNQNVQWLAYQQISTSDYILTESGFLFATWPSIKPWTTVYLRLIEAASIKLAVSEAPMLVEGALIVGQTGSGKVIKKIKDNDDNIVLLLNNITGAFTLPPTVNGYSTDSTWGYRSKDNYIWAFYGDTSAHGTNNTNPLDNNRLANPRNATLVWALGNMADWTAAKDNFRLIQWNTTVNNSSDGDPQIRLMGKGNELNTIIRTNKIITASSYASEADFPAILGLACIGDSCDGELEWGQSTAYFDDLAYWTSGGSGTPSGVQY